MYKNNYIPVDLTIILPIQVRFHIPGMRRIAMSVLVADFFIVCTLKVGTVRKFLKPTALI